MNKISEDMLYGYVGTALANARKLAKPSISQQYVAEQLGLTRASISNLERGVQKAPLSLIYKYCAFLDLDVSRVFPSIEDIQSESIKRDVSKLDIDTELPSGVAKVLRTAQKAAK